MQCGLAVASRLDDQSRESNRLFHRRFELRDFRMLQNVTQAFFGQPNVAVSIVLNDFHSIVLLVRDNSAQRSLVRMKYRSDAMPSTATATANSFSVACDKIQRMTRI